MVDIIRRHTNRRHNGDNRENPDSPHHRGGFLWPFRARLCLSSHYIVHVLSLNSEMSWNIGDFVEVSFYYRPSKHAQETNPYHKGGNACDKKDLMSTFLPGVFLLFGIVSISCCYFADAPS